MPRLFCPIHAHPQGAGSRRAGSGFTPPELLEQIPPRAVPGNKPGMPVNGMRAYRLGVSLVAMILLYVFNIF